MTDPLAWQSADWRAALAIRATVLKRRHASALEVVVLLAVCGLTWLVGKALAPRAAVDPGLLPILALLGPLALLLLLASGAGTLLYASRELVLLVSHGVAPRDLVRVRLVELTALALLGLTPLAVCLAGAQVAGGTRPSPGLALATLLGAPALAGLGVLAAWLAANQPWRKRALVALLLAAGALAVGLRLRAPGAQILAAAAGGPAQLAGLAALAVAGPAAALWIAPRGFAEALDRGVGRSRSGAAHAWRLLGVLAAPARGQAAALIQRDLALLFRGGFLRGAALLVLLPLPLGILIAVRGDANLEAWHLSLVGLLLTGVLSSASGFLFGVDFPRHRRAQLLLERTQPLQGRAVLRSRWLPAVGYALLLVLGAAALIATAEPRLAKAWTGFLPCGALLALIVTHHAVTYGMRSEGQLDPAEAAAYPMNGAAVVILFGLGLAVHPAVAIAYPLLWSGFVRSAIQRWETAEVETEHQAAA